MEILLERAQKLDPEWMAEHYDRIRKRWQNQVEPLRGRAGATHLRGHPLR